MPLLLLGSLGLPEILMIFAVILLLFGPTKLPEIGKALGKGIREFKKGTSGLVDSINDISKTETVQRPPNQPQAKAIQPPAEKVVDVEAVVVDLEKEAETTKPAQSKNEEIN